MTSPLEGITVLDFGQYMAGPLTAMLLADQGARVVRIELPGGPAWRTPVNSLLLRNREVVSLDLMDARDRQTALHYAETADVLIENFRPGVMERLRLGADELLRRNPRLVYSSLPGFGRDDPRAASPGWEGVVLAACGCYTGSQEMLPGEWWPSDGPAFTPLMLGSVFAGTQAAVGVTAALIARERDGGGQHVEVPLHDAFYEAIGARALRYERNAPRGSLLGSGFYRCGDGRYVSLITVWHRHLEWFLASAGVGAWIEDGTADYTRLLDSAAAEGELRRRLVALFTTRPARDWEEIGREAGVPIAALRSTAEWLQEEQSVASGSMTEPVGGGAAGPGLAVRLRDRAEAGRRAFPPGEVERNGPLVGLRVLDMSRVLAAPTISRVLADLGAEVVRADVSPGGGRAGLREPFFHESVNRGKRCVPLDLNGDDGGKLRALCAWADVIVTNYTQPALRRMGLDEESLRGESPHLVHTYLNAFGTSGPWADFRGYAEIANTVTGITARTLGAGPPSGVAPNVDLPRTPFTDYTAGLLGAFGVLTALYRRSRTGRSSAVETSLLDAAVLQQLPFLIDDVPDRNAAEATPGWSDLQRLYRARDGWVFVGLAESHRAVFLEALGVDPAPSDQVGSHIASAVEELSRHEIGRLLHHIGGSAHPLVALDSLLERGGPADLRGLRLEHDSPEFGTVVQPGPAIRMHRTPMHGRGLPTTESNGPAGT